MPIETADLISSQASTEREADLHALPELFLENTKLRPHAEMEVARRILYFFADPRKVSTARQSFKAYPGAPKVRLSVPATEDSEPSFDCVIRRRRSADLSDPQQAFSSMPMPAELLSRLLHYTYGVVERDDLEEGGERPRLRRASPSAGALYPLELYPIVLNVDGVAPGVYHYDALRHQIELLHTGEVPGFKGKVESLLSRGTAIGDAAVVLVTTAIPLRTTYKYGDRGYRLLLLEAGHAAQNTYLAAAALGVSACAVGGFFDEEVNRMLQVNGLDELAVYVTLLGLPRRGGGR